MKPRTNPGITVKSALFPAGQTNITSSADVDLYSSIPVCYLERVKVNLQLDGEYHDTQHAVFFSQCLSRNLAPPKGAFPTYLTRKSLGCGNCSLTKFFQMHCPLVFSCVLQGCDFLLQVLGPVAESSTHTIQLRTFMGPKPENIMMSLENPVKSLSLSLQYTHHVSAALANPPSHFLLPSGYRNDVESCTGAQKVKFLEKVRNLGGLFQLVSG